MEYRVVDGQIIEIGGPKVRVTFYEHPLQVGKGRYVPADYIKRQAIGARDFVSRRATEQDKLDYPAEWEAYQRGLVEDSRKESDLSVLPAFKKHLGLELQAIKVNTIEQLAFCDECPVDGGETLWKQAKRYVQLLEEENELSESAQAVS